MDVLQERRGRKVADIKQYRSKKALKEQNDTKVMKFLYNCFRYSGLTPFSLEHPHICPKLVFLTIFVGAVGNTCYCFMIWTTIDADISTDIIMKLIFVFNVPFAFFCTIAANFCIQQWKKFTKSFRNLEKFLTECDFQCHVKQSVIYAQISIPFTIFFIEHIIYFTLRVQEGVWNRFKQTAVWSLFGVYRIFVAVYIAMLAQLLRRRYLYINEMIKVKQEDAKKAMAIGELIQKVVDCTNQIFGWHLFLHFSIYVILLLGAVSNIIVTGDLENSSLYFFTGNTVSLVMLVMSCDALEKSGKKIIKTCYMLHESVGNKLIKEELFLLATYAEQWKPTLSAAGFYDLNQTTLSTLFEAIITYLVIIIQFNLALA